MKDEVRPVTFYNKNNKKLFGMLHVPINEAKDMSIVILSPGIKNRVAPHRLYVKMAKRFCEMGFYVFRFDPEGLGDSEGEIKENYLADVYGSIQLGRFLDDTISAMDWVEKELKIHKFILSGLCGGAIAGLHAGAIDDRVKSILAIGIPVILEGTNIDNRDFLTQSEIDVTKKKYLLKLFNLKAWGRLITLKSDFKLMFVSFIKPIKNGVKVLLKNNEHLIKAHNEKKHESTNLNPHFNHQLINFLKKGRALFIFGEYDRLFKEFKEKYIERYRNELKNYDERYKVVIIERANHIFSFSEWYNSMINSATEWIQQNYP